jgi:hypothetical protein
MRSALIVALAVIGVAASRPAAAAVISFDSPDLALGTCQNAPYPPPGIALGKLRVYEEAGVRVDVVNNYPGHFNLTVDCSNPVNGLGPVIGPCCFDPYLAAIDLDTMAVTSLSGDAIRRIRLTVTDFFGPPAACDLLVFSIGISICDFSGDLYFADYGFPNGVTSFSMKFATYNYEGFASIQQIEVPEPVGGALLALGLGAAVRRWRRASTVATPYAGPEDRRPKTEDYGNST